MKVIEFPKPASEPLMAAEAKVMALETLQDLIGMIEADEVESIFLVASNGPSGTTFLRCGTQDFQLAGGVSWLQHRMLEGIE